jgi:hypothetical protein
MSQQDAFAEAVFFFEGPDVAAEMYYAEFEALLDHAATLEAFAASVVRGAYAVVGTGLAVRGLVCFQLSIDEEGWADSEFRVPLRHLVRTAGMGPDVGCGPVRLACRSQCSVSWHAMNLWEPDDEPEAHPLKVVQSAVWRNRLGLKLTPVAQDDAPLLGVAVGLDVVPQEMAPPQPAARREHKIDETLDGDGRVSLQQLIQQHAQQLESQATKHRADLEQQQQIYLDQIRGCRDEIQKLKSLLRQEQHKNRRLQQLLRGELGS